MPRVNSVRFYSTTKNFSKVLAWSVRWVASWAVKIHTTEIAGVSQSLHELQLNLEPLFLFFVRPCDTEYVIAPHDGCQLCPQNSCTRATRLRQRGMPTIPPALMAPLVATISMVANCKIGTEPLSYRVCVILKLTVNYISSVEPEK